MGKRSGFRTIVILITLVLWIGIAYGLASWMFSKSMGEWWQLLIAQSFLWLAYVMIARMIEGDIFEQD